MVAVIVKKLLMRRLLLPTSGAVVRLRDPRATTTMLRIHLLAGPLKSIRPRTV
jgi:hypothetical protein